MTLNSDRHAWTAMTAGLACLMWGSAMPAAHDAELAEADEPFAYGPTVVVDGETDTSRAAASITLDLSEGPSTRAFLALASDIIAKQEALEPDIQQVISSNLRRYLD